MLPDYAISFIITLIGIYLSFNAPEEIAILGTIVALVSLFISCALAPWLIQCLVVIFAWWGIRYICRNSQC